MAPKELREPTFLVLTALAAGPLHGYGLMQAVNVSTDGDVTLRPGTLYTALDRLTVEGLVAIVGEETVDGRPRRYYELTEAGAAALAEAAARLEARAQQARAALASRPRRTVVTA